MSDPIQVENLTDTLLSNLEPCRRDAVDDEERSFQARLTSLPEDVFHIILSHLRSYRDLPRRANHTLPQQFWKDELTLGAEGLLPWLWDIDRRKVNLKASQPCPGGKDFEWNWELLVRQLSRGVDGGIQSDVPEHIDVYASGSDRKGFEYLEDLWTCTGYDDDLKFVPRGLHNRRRIWQLLEELMVGDQLPLVGRPVGHSREVPPMQKCVELPWNREGDLRSSGIWLPSIDSRYAFVRRIGGHISRIAGKSPLQYWQTREFRAQNGEEWDTLVKPASALEVLGVIKKLGYPISV